MVSVVVVVAAMGGLCCKSRGSYYYYRCLFSKGLHSFFLAKTLLFADAVQTRENVLILCETLVLVRCMLVHVQGLRTKAKTHLANLSPLQSYEQYFFQKDTRQYGNSL